jgi:hypothetical protein
MTDEKQETSHAVPALGWWVRGTLLGTALGWIAVFCVAAWLRPYTPDGQPLRMESHRQLGLPECTFKKVTGLPCPSCGMTTSFSLLIHGDLINSVKANAVGTLLALFGLVFIPWSLASVVCRRTLFITSMELALIKLIGTFVILMILRWGIVLALAWWNGST